MESHDLLIKYVSAMFPGINFAADFRHFIQSIRPGVWEAVVPVSAPVSTNAIVRAVVDSALQDLWVDEIVAKLPRTPGTAVEMAAIDVYISDFPKRGVPTKEGAVFANVTSVGPQKEVDDERDYLAHVKATYSWAPAVLADSLPNAREIDLTTQYLRLRATAEVAFDFRGGEVAGCEIRDKPESVSQRPMPAAGTEIGLTPAVRDWLSGVLGPKSGIRDDATAGDGQYLVRELDVESAIGLSDRCVVVGSPGSGKSTVLRHLAMRSAAQLLAGPKENNLGSSISGIYLWHERPKLPILISLPRLVRECLPDEMSEPTGTVILHYLKTTLLDRLGVGNEFLRRRLREGSACLLLDGLDEIPNAASPNRRNQMRMLVGMLQKQYPGIRIVITARTYAYAGDWKIPDFDVVGIDDLDTTQLRELVSALSMDWSETDQQKSFAQRILDLPDDIRNTPFLVMLYWVVWQHRVATGETGALPTNRTALYSACIDAVVESSEKRPIDEIPSLSSLGISQFDFRALLEELAFCVQEGEAPSALAGEASAPLFVSGLVMTAARATGIKGINYDGLLEILAARVGFIREQAPERFQFLHRSFQEYLAARRLCADEQFPKEVLRTIPLRSQQWLQVMEYVLELALTSSLPLAKLVEGLLDHLKDADDLSADDPVWWLVLYAGLAYQICIRQGEVVNAPVVEDLQKHCLALLDCAALPARERTKVGDVLAEIGDPRPGVLVGPEGLPDVAFVGIDIPMSESGDAAISPYGIGRYPVTNAQFGAFTSAEDGYNDSQWWRGIPHVPGGWFAPEWNLANRPRERVSWYEAVAYCRWLSAKTGRNIRLPTTTEWRQAALGGGVARDDYPYGARYSPLLGNTAQTRVGQTSAVGIYPGGRSVYGVDDLSGNVWDWCIYPTDLVPSVDQVSSAIAPVRGGSRSSTPEDARATVEHCTRNRAGRHSDLGFRVVRVDDAEPLLAITSVEPAPLRTIRRSTDFVTADSTVSEIISSTLGRAIRVARFGPSGIIVGSSLGHIVTVPLGKGLVHVPEEIPPMEFAVRALSAARPGRVVVGCEDGSIRVLWPFAKTMAHVGRHSGPVYGLLERGDEVISVGRDGVVRRWSLPVGGLSFEETEAQGIDLQPVAELDLQLGTIYCIGISAERIVVGTDQGALTHIDPENGPISTIASFGGAVLSVTCLTTGECAAVSADGLAVVTDERLEVTTTFEAHQDMVRTVSFGEGPHVVFTGSKDGTVRMTDLESGARTIFAGHADYVYDCLYLPEIGALVSASGDGTVRSWPLDWSAR